MRAWCDPNVVSDPGSECWPTASSRRDGCEEGSGSEAGWLTAARSGQCSRRSCGDTLRGGSRTGADHADVASRWPRAMSSCSACECRCTAVGGSTSRGGRASSAASRTTHAYRGSGSVCRSRWSPDVRPIARFPWW